MATDSGEAPVRHPVPSPHAPQPFVLALVALAAGVAMVELLIVGDRHTNASAQFTGHSEFIVWVAFAAGLVGVSVAAGAYTLPAWRKLKARSRLAALLESCGLYAAILVASFAGPPLLVRGSSHYSQPLPLYQGTMRMAGFFALAGLPAFPSVSGLVLAALLLSRKERLWHVADAGAAVAELLRIRRYLQRFLTALALIIGGTVLATGGLRSALLADGWPKTSFPVVNVLLYGAFFTGLMALVYIPAYLAWQARAQELVDELYPLPPDGRAGHDWYVGRADLEGLLNLKAKAGSVFVTALGLLAPFATSLVTTVVTGISPPS